MDKTPSNIDDVILYRYLLNDLEESERRTVEAWLKQNKEHQEHLESLHSITKSADLKFFNEINVERAWEAVKNQTINKKQSDFWPQFIRYAAAIALLAVVGIGSYYTLFRSSLVELTARDAPYSLNDGTKVWLNTGSTLTYDAEFKDGRRVQLKGEAFFEVQHDPDHPFQVKLQNTTTTVLGTSFNLEGYSEDTVLLALVTGKVAFSSGKQSIELTPGERAIFANNNLEKTTNTDLNFQSWKTGVLSFDNIPMNEVIDVLNDYYQSSLVLENQEAYNCPLTATFDNESLNEILETISIIFDAEIHKQQEKTSIKMQPCNL